MRCQRLISPGRGGRGSAFVTVMIFTCVLFLLTGAILQWSMTERRLNVRNAYWLEARNAAEATAEYGFAQVVTQFNSHATPPSFDPAGTTPLTKPSSSFFTGGNVSPSSIEVIAGTASVVPTTGSLYYVDPNNPDSKFDTLRGQYVYRRDIQVLAKATVSTSFGPPITSYVTEKVSIRGAPLFAHAIFYSDNDLEAAPGPTLDIYGPVHVNGSMFPTAQGTVETGTANAVNFHGPVSVTGDIYHAWGNQKPASQGRGYSSSSATLDGEPLGNDPVTFVSAAGTQVNMRTSGGTWKDSMLGADSTVFNSQGRYADVTTAALDQLKTKLDPAFRQYAAQTWNGNVQTAAMGVAPYHPISFTQPIDAAGTLPDPHVIIEPPDTTLTTADPYYSPKEEVELQKLASQTGLYVQVAVTPGTAGAADPRDTATIKLYGPPGSAPSGTPAAEVGPNGGILLGTVPNNMVNFVPYKSTRVAVGSYITASGDPNYHKYPVTTTTAGAAATTAAVTYASTAPTPSQVVNQALYDQRQTTGINLVQVDVGALRTALTQVTAGSPDLTKAITDSTGTAVWGGSSSAGGGWNGGVYIEVKPASGSSFPSQTSIMLANATVASGSSLVPAVNSVPGLTIATNAPAYILGHFNSDGASVDLAASNNAAQYPDDGRTNASGTPTSAEIPVAIAADAITILSPNYFGTAAGTKLVPATNASGSAYNSWSTTAPSASGDTEVAAAFITGIVSTTNTGFSGGVHNLPRFIENWGTNTVAIRGSLVSLYKSKVAVGPWAQRYYSAPKRNWGFDKIFENGTFPPLTPRVMSYRRVDFTDLSATAYNAAKHALWPTRY